MMYELVMLSYNSAARLSIVERQHCWKTIWVYIVSTEVEFILFRIDSGRLGLCDMCYFVIGAVRQI